MSITNKFAYILLVVSLIIVSITGFIFLVGSITLFEDSERLLDVMGDIWRPILYFGAAAWWLLVIRFVKEVLGRVSEKTLRIIKVVSIITAFLIQILFLVFSGNAYKWDALYCIGASGSLSQTGSIADPGIYHYIEIYPNQNMFVMLTAFIMEIASHTGVSSLHMHFVLDMMNIICLDLGCLFTYGLLVKKEDPANKKVGVLLYLLSNPFLYLCVNYYYTITLSLPFSMGGLYFLFKKCEKSSNKILYAIIGGLMLGIGYAIRPTTIIFMMAAVLALILVGMKRSKEDEDKKSTWFKFMFLPAMVVCIMICSKVSGAYVGIDTTDSAFPTTHWFMMSLTRPGVHNIEDEDYTNSFATQEEKKEMVKVRLKEKLSAMSAKDFLLLAKDKMEIVFWDGSHGYTEFRVDGERSDGAYELIYGTHRDAFVIALQGYQCLIYLSIFVFAISLLKGLKKGSSPEMLQLTILYTFMGSVCFYLLWEAGSNYGLPFMFIFQAAAFFGYGKLTEAEPDNVKNRIAPVLAILALCPFSLYLATHTKDLLKDKFEYEHNVSSQTVGFEELELGDGEAIIQNVKIREDFNHVIFQWRNLIGNKNDSVYEVVMKMGDEVILKDEIKPTEAYHGYYEHTFDENITYHGNGSIEIRKTAGAPDHNLGFVICSVPGFTPYYGGEMTDSASFLFSINDKRMETYTRAKRLSLYILLIAASIIAITYVQIKPKKAR